MAAPIPVPGKGDYLCYEGKCYSKPGYGSMDKQTCEETCSALRPVSHVATAGKGAYFCFQGKCYDKPGYGKLQKEDCEKTCLHSNPDLHHRQFSNGTDASKGEYL